MIFITFSLICWLFLFWLSTKAPKCNIPYVIRGGGGGGSTETTTHTYYFYRIRIPHNSVDPSQSILAYNAFGVLIFTINSLSIIHINIIGRNSKN